MKGNLTYFFYYGIKIFSSAKNSPTISSSIYLECLDFKAAIEQAVPNFQQTIQHSQESME